MVVACWAPLAVSALLHPSARLGSSRAHGALVNMALHDAPADSSCAGGGGTDTAHAAARALEVAAWSPSVDFVEFTVEMYAMMVGDQERTAAFELAIQRRLAGHADDWVVLDIGTGPSAILSVFAALAGAKRVYAIEANAAIAERAREAVALVEHPERGSIAPGTIVVVEGFSTAVTLPERADLLVAEIVGSVASEEGMYRTIQDARRRHLKRPDDPASFIPARCQTVAVPASYAEHHKKACNWTASGPPVRLACSSPWLRPLSTPQLWEDFALWEDPTATAAGNVLSLPAPLEFRISGATIEANRQLFAEQLEQLEDVPAGRAAELAVEMSGSISGLACWPRIVLDEGSVTEDEPPIIIESRGSEGEPRTSHWQTVLPLLCTKPVAVGAGDVVSVVPTITLAEEGESPPRYEIRATLLSE